MIILAALAAILYTLVCLSKPDSFRVLLSIAFVLVSIALRFEIDPQSVRDFSPYLKSLEAVDNGNITASLLIEPYRLILYKVVLLLVAGDSLIQIKAAYYFHFFIITGFFLWLSWLKNTNVEFKLLLFLAFYPNIAFVWLRSGMAYAATCYFFLKFSSGRLQALSYVLPVFHSSTLLPLALQKLQSIRPIYRVGALIALALIAYYGSETSYGAYVVSKLDRYFETSDHRTSVLLLLFHILNLFTVLYIITVTMKFRPSFFLGAVCFSYFLMYFASPIIALRAFPYVLIAAITERVVSRPSRALSPLLVAAYVPIYFFRVDQIFV